MSAAHRSGADSSRFGTVAVAEPTDRGVGRCLACRWSFADRGAAAVTMIATALAVVVASVGVEAAVMGVGACCDGRRGSERKRKESSQDRYWPKIYHGLLKACLRFRGFVVARLPRASFSPMSVDADIAKIYRFKFDPRNRSYVHVPINDFNWAVCCPTARGQNSR